MRFLNQIPFSGNHTNRLSKCLYRTHVHIICLVIKQTIKRKEETKENRNDGQLPKFEHTFRNSTWIMNFFYEFNPRPTDKGAHTSGWAGFKTRLTLNTRLVHAQARPIKKRASFYIP